MITRRFLGALAVLLATVLVSADQQRSFVSGVEVRVVNVEVMVTDSSGLPVTDLTPADFEIREDGKPQEISNFFRIVNGSAQLTEAQRTSGVSAEDERFRRRVLVVVDDNFLTPVTRRQALDRLRDFITQRFDGEAEWGVAAIGEQLDYLLPFTHDRFQVSSALDVIDGLPTLAYRHSPDLNLRDDPVRTQYMQSEGGAGPNIDLGAEYRFVSRETAMRNLRSFGTMAQVLGGLMRSYSGFGGRKAIVLVTGQMEFHPEMQYLVSRDPRTFSDSGLTDRTQSDPTLAAAKNDLEAILDGIVRAANSSGFQLYTVQAQGLRNPVRTMDVANRSLGMSKDIGAFASPPELSDPTTAPMMLAQGTGGMALASNALENDLSRIVDDTATYYSLGYQPQHTPDRAYHKITVKVKRDGLKVRFREGYLDLTATQKIAEELATPLSFPKPKGDLPVTLAVQENGEDAGKIRLLAHVQLPVRSITLLPAAEGGLHGEIELFLAIYDEKGENVAVIPKHYPLDVPAGEEEAARAGMFRPTLAFELKPGAYTVTVTVRDPVVQERGTAVQQVLAGNAKG